MYNKKPIIKVNKVNNGNNVFRRNAKPTETSKYIESKMKYKMK